VPVNVHRVNWLWINRDLLRKVGGRVPDSWDQFFSLADRFKAAGIVPLAHGGQPWQDLTTFEIVVLGVGGPDFYRQALVTMDPAAWRSPTMTRVIDTFRRLKSYTDAGAPGRDWNKATEMVIKGQAGMQFMGDWAKGEFLAAGKKPETDFVCTAAPGTWSAYIYNIDSFAMFRLKDAQAVIGQNALAATIMSGPFQEIFNRNKGSIPVALGANMASFDYCARESSGYFVAASLANSLVPSFAHKMAQSEAHVAVVQAIVARLWDEDAWPSGTGAGQPAAGHQRGERRHHHRHGGHEQRGRTGIARRHACARERLPGGHAHRVGEHEEQRQHDPVERAGDGPAQGIGPHGRKRDAVGIERHAGHDHEQREREPPAARRLHGSFRQRPQRRDGEHLGADRQREQEVFGRNVHQGCVVRRRACLLPT
jgi:hypothetical protein